MYKDQKITVVVPAYNEERQVGQVIHSVPDYVDHVVVVDDCSLDNTYQIAEASGDRRVRVLRTLDNQGVGGATILGYQKAIELGSDIIVKMDGDGQMSPEYLNALLDGILEKRFDYAKGNRFLAGDSLAQMPRHRLFGNIVLTFMTKLASGYWHIFDPQNGYTAIKTEVLQAMDLNSIHKRYFFENDMLIHLSFRGFRVVDVAIPARYAEEQSGMNLLSVSLTFPVVLLRRFSQRIYQRYILRDFSPIALFLILGMILFMWGTFFGLYIWIKAAITQLPTLTGTIMLALLPLILGFQLILQAIVLDIDHTPK